MRNRRNYGDDEFRVFRQYGDWDDGGVEIRLDTDLADRLADILEIAGTYPDRYGNPSAIVDEGWLDAADALREAAEAERNDYTPLDT